MAGYLTGVNQVFPVTFGLLMLQIIQAIAAEALYPLDLRQLNGGTPTYAPRST
jgi:hypothetical protein